MKEFLVKFFPGVYKRMMEERDDKNAYCTFDSHLLTLFTSSLYLAALAASLFASIVTTKYGRRTTMFFGGFVYLLGSVLNGIAESIIILIFGRLLLGVGIGFANQVKHIHYIIPYIYNLTNQGYLPKSLGLKIEFMNYYFE